MGYSSYVVPRRLLLVGSAYIQRTCLPPTHCWGHIGLVCVVIFPYPLSRNHLGLVLASVRGQCPITVKAACRMRHVKCHFGRTPAEGGVLDGVDLQENAEVVCLVSGKSKLVHCGRLPAATRENSCRSQDAGSGAYF